MKIVFEEVKEWDKAKEIKRLKRCFRRSSPKIFKKLMEITVLFEQFEFEKCVNKIKKLGYNEKDEHPNIEYVDPFILDTIRFIGPGRTTRKVE